MQIQYRTLSQAPGRVSIDKPESLTDLRGECASHTAQTLHPSVPDQLPISTDLCEALRAVLRAARESAELSLTEVAELSGLNRQAIFRDAENSVLSGQGVRR